MKACNELTFGETYVNRENFEAMQGSTRATANPASAAPMESMVCWNTRPRTLCYIQT